MAAVDEKTLTQLLELIGGDKGSLIELIESFLFEGSKLIAQLQEPDNQSDLELLRRASHTMRSSALDFGASTLAELCATLESQSNQESVDDVSSQVSRIGAEFDLAKKALGKVAANLRR